MNKNETPEEFEARMIAQFNAQVNASSPNGEKKDAQLSAKQEKKCLETGGPQGLEPTRYGDWEAKGRCFDF